MKSRFALFAILVLGSPAVFAQGDLVRVRSGHSFEEEFPVSVRYRFSAFQAGKIMYTNGKTSQTHRFNYDILFGAVLTIQAFSLDTIVLADNPDYRYFFIKDAIYVRMAVDKYAEVIIYTDSVKLALSEKFVIKRRDRKVSDGYNTFVDNVNSVRSTTNMGYGRMIYDQDLLMTKVSRYYLVDKSGTIYDAKKSSFLKLFPDHRELIKTYIDRNFIDFRSRNDLTKLFDYCNRL